MSRIPPPHRPRRVRGAAVVDPRLAHALGARALERAVEAVVAVDPVLVGHVRAVAGVVTGVDRAVVAVVAQERVGAPEAGVAVVERTLVSVVAVRRFAVAGSVASDRVQRGAADREDRPVRVDHRRGAHLAAHREDPVRFPRRQERVEVRVARADEHAPDRIDGGRGGDGGGDLGGPPGGAVVGVERIDEPVVRSEIQRPVGRYRGRMSHPADRLDGPFRFTGVRRQGVHVGQQAEQRPRVHRAVGAQRR